MIVETSRLWLREMKEDDFEDLCEMLCDKEVMYAYAHAFSTLEAKAWLDNQMRRYQEDGVGLWAVIRKEDHKMIGQCGITKQSLHSSDVWEIGYLFKKAYWHMGYAMEAASACRNYAFEIKKIPRVYSIIRDMNVASKRVAIACGMQSVDHIVKHYYDMDMPHDVYAIDNNSVMKHVYIDAEFDAVKINHRFTQMLISLGAYVTTSTGEVLTTFYETIHPQNYRRTSRVVYKMTGLNEDTIRHSRNLQEVLDDFLKVINQFDQNMEHFLFYSFGPDDKRTIQQHCTIEQVDYHGLFQDVVDLQKPLSKSVQYHGSIVSPTLSLDDLKLAYHIAGEVEHNALTDARDLMYLHQSYIAGKHCDITQVEQIVQRKAEKQQAALRKQKARISKVMKERFGHVPEKVHVVFHHEVLEQFRVWETRDEHFQFHFKKELLCFENRKYDYDSINLHLFIQTDEQIPSIIVRMDTQEEWIEKTYELTYRNASAIESILKRLEAHRE